MIRVIGNEQRGIWLNLRQVIEPPLLILITVILKNLCGKTEKKKTTYSPKAHQDYICFLLLPAIQILLHLQKNKW